MAYQFSFDGGYVAQPISGVPSGAPVVETPINEAVILDKRHVDEIDLDTDSATNVSFGGVTNANVIVLRSTGGKVRARLTSADGSQQSVPIDPFFSLISLSVPVTAIDLTRVPATPASVEVFLGQKA